MLVSYEEYKVLGIGMLSQVEMVFLVVVRQADKILTVLTLSLLTLNRTVLELQIFGRIIKHFAECRSDECHCAEKLNH